jgi:hypothetical protein
MKPEPAEIALTRIQDPTGRALRGLAQVALRAALDSPAEQWLDARWLAETAQRTILDLTASDAAAASALRSLETMLTAREDDIRPLGYWIPPSASEWIRAAVQRPWSPDESLVHRLLDQPAVRQLVQEVLEDTLTRFQRRLRSLDATGIGALGMRAARRGRGLLGGVAQNLGGIGLGGLTEGIVGAVAEELENAVQQKITDFVTNATGEAIRAAARHVADPQHAVAFGKLREGAVQVLLDLPVNKAAEEVQKLDPAAWVDLIRRDLRRAAQSEDASVRWEASIREAFAAFPHATLGSWLDELHVRDIWEPVVVDALVRQMQVVVTTPAFEAWWADLFQP